MTGHVGPLAVRSAHMRNVKDDEVLIKVPATTVTLAGAEGALATGTKPTTSRDAARDGPAAEAVH